MKEQLELPEKCKGLLLGLKDTQDLIKGKWKVIIIQALYFGEYLSFSDLKRYITGISPKMLAQELKDLESNHLVSRKEKEAFPVSVEYSLTCQGRNLHEVVQLMAQWGKEYREELYTEKITEF